MARREFADTRLNDRRRVDGRTIDQRTQRQGTKRVGAPMAAAAHGFFDEADGALEDLEDDAFGFFADFEEVGEDVADELFGSILGTDLPGPLSLGGKPKFPKPSGNIFKKHAEKRKQKKRQARRARRKAGRQKSRQARRAAAEQKRKWVEGQTHLHPVIRQRMLEEVEAEYGGAQATFVSSSTPAERVRRRKQAQRQRSRRSRRSEEYGWLFDSAEV